MTPSLEITKALADTIRECREVPSGELYARVMPYMDLITYDRIIGDLIRGGLVAKRNHLLVWKGMR